MTRRGLLAAGGLALLAGCGKDDAAEPLPTASESLLLQLAAERASAASLDGLDARAPAADRELVRRLARRADDRARRLAAAVAAEGGRPHDAPAPDEPDSAVPDDAIERSRAAVAAHVEGIQWLGGDELRRLGTGLVTESAADLAVLGAVFGISTAEAFPG